MKTQMIINSRNFPINGIKLFFTLLFNLFRLAVKLLTLTVKLFAAAIKLFSLVVYLIQTISNHI